MQVMDPEEVGPLLHLVPLPGGQGVELLARHAEGELKVLRAEVLLQVAAVEVRRQLVVGGEEDVEGVHLVLSCEDGGGGAGPAGDRVAGQGGGGGRSGRRDAIGTEEKDFLFVVAHRLKKY